MTLRIMLNQPFGKTLIHSTVNVNIVVVGNNSVSNIATTGEVVTSADIRRVWWGSAGANSWFIYRGVIGGSPPTCNLVAVLNPTSDAEVDYHEKGASISLDSTGNLVCNCGDTTGGSFILIELGKESANGDPQY